MLSAPWWRPMKSKNALQAKSQSTWITYLTCTVSQERKGPKAIFERIINKNIFMQTPIKLLVFALGLSHSTSADSNQAETPTCSWYESWCESPVSLLKSVTKSLIVYPFTPNSNHNKISKKVFSFLKNTNKTKVLPKTGFIWMVTPKKIHPQIWK